MNKSLIVGVIVLGAAGAQAQINFTGSYSQNFDTLPNSGSNPGTWTDNSTLAGWYSNRTLIRYDVGGLNTGSLYSYGLQDTTERAFGAVSSGTARPILFGVRLRNMSGNSISAIDVSFVGEQWRAAGSTSTPLAQTTFLQL